MRITKGRRQVHWRVVLGAGSILLLATNISGTAVASDPGSALTDSQVEGRRLFGQSCAVCHTPPLVVLGTYGPVLSKQSLGGAPEAMRAFIGVGSSRMPGFRYHFSPAQIDAIVQYLQSVDPPTQRSAPKSPFNTHGDM